MKLVLVINPLIVVVFNEAMSGAGARQQVSLGALLVVRGHGPVLAQGLALEFELVGVVHEADEDRKL